MLYILFDGDIMEVRLNNIDTKLDYFTPDKFGILYIDWADPIAITMIRAYQLERRIDKVRSLNNYIEFMLSSATPSNNRYTRIEQISSRGDVENITARLTTTILTNFNYLDEFNRTDLKRYLQHLISEMLNNVADHAGGYNGGFSMAQYYPTKKKVQIAVADRGVGFLRHIGHVYPHIRTEEDALLKAIERGVTASSNTMYGHERNAGYGLFALVEIIKETKGRLVIISNDGILSCNNGVITTATLSQSWTGTVVAFEFIEKNTDFDYNDMISRLVFIPDPEDEDFF